MRQVVMEDLLTRASFYVLKISPRKLNSRYDGLDQLVHLCGDRGDLFALDLL